ncbi:DUF3850 domain-containing protein [Aeromonas hydrophila]|uniref:DUF3850 domain-containing protein n=1 Tax=Aeromonas hydrophila TaxID=644 RepID=UPI0038D07F35
MKHELKIKPEYLAAIHFGEKTFEIRNNADRNFQVGDALLLKGWNGKFTGDFVEKVVSYITDFEQKPGYVVLGLVNHREHELLEKFHRTGVAIERAISTGSVLADHPLKSRLELLANHHKRETELAANLDRAERALICSGFTYTEGAQEWKPPIGPSASPLLERIDQLAAQLSDVTRQCGVMADSLRHQREFVADNVWDDEERAALLESIEAALAGKLPESEAPDALVAMSDIASLQRYTLGGHCDSFGQDCGAEMEQDDEGEYIMLAEALALSPSKQGD